MKEKIYKICTKLNDGQIAVTEATEQLLELLGISEQCAHPIDKRQYIDSNMLRCKACGSYADVEIYKYLKKLSNSVGETITERHCVECCRLMKVIEDRKIINF